MSGTAQAHGTTLPEREVEVRAGDVAVMDGGPPSSARRSSGTAKGGRATGGAATDWPSVRALMLRQRSASPDGGCDLPCGRSASGANTRRFVRYF